jgi:hypothetical protein
MNGRGAPPVLPGLAAIVRRAGQSVCAKVATLAGRNGGARICAGREALPVARLPDPATIDRRCPQVPWSGARGVAKLRESWGVSLMLSRYACMGIAAIALGATLGLTLIAASPAAAQTAATEPPQAIPQPPHQPASPAPSATPASEPSPAAQPTPAAAETPPAPPADPLVAEVRRLLAEPAKGNVDRADRAALVAFYGERSARCHGGNRQGRRLGARGQRLRVA